MNSIRDKEKNRDAVYPHEEHCHVHEGTDHAYEGVIHAHEDAVHKHEGAIHMHGGHPHVHENKKAVTNRLARIIGHLQSVKTMVEDDRDCSEILIQLSAVNSAVKGVSREILKEHLSTCIVDAVKKNDYQALDDLNDAIDKFIK